MYSQAVKKFKILYQKISEVTPSCLLMMVQGDLSAITLTHWIKAFSTGTLTAIGMILLSFIKSNKEFYENKYLLAGLTSIVTMIVDYKIHPSHYSGNYTEALMTGLAAGIICFIMTKFWKKDN
jgi:hypothetical protein